MAINTVACQQRLDIARVVNAIGGGWWQRLVGPEWQRQPGRQQEEKEEAFHGVESGVARKSEAGTGQRARKRINSHPRMILENPGG
jgi:hypothetical protein